jgi:hypothetical protein
LERDFRKEEKAMTRVGIPIWSGLSVYPGKSTLSGLPALHSRRPDGSTPLKKSAIGRRSHLLSGEYCDEVTHIATSVPFDYCSKSAQRDSSESKRSFLVFNPFLTGFRPDVRSYRLESH